MMCSAKILLIASLFSKPRPQVITDERRGKESWEGVKLNKQNNCMEVLSF